MSNKKSIYMPLMIACLVAIAICIICGFYILVSSQTSIYMKISGAFTECALFAALIYVFDGCKKLSAKYFQGFLVLCAIAELASIVNSAEIEKSAFPLQILLKTIIFGLLLILAFGKNLGKTNSFVITLVIVALNIFMFVMSIVSLNGASLTSDVSKTFYLVHALSNLIISLAILICIYAKYVDKALRGSK